MVLLKDSEISLLTLEITTMVLDKLVLMTWLNLTNSKPKLKLIITNTQTLVA
jgi:hypothetical protein